MFKKVITLLFGTALMVVLMLAAGGIYLLPENVMGVFSFTGIQAALTVEPSITSRLVGIVLTLSFRRLASSFFTFPGSIVFCS